jgi:hypothetical protein
MKVFLVVAASLVFLFLCYTGANRWVAHQPPDQFQAAMEMLKDYPTAAGKGGKK